MDRHVINHCLYKVIDRQHDLIRELKESMSKKDREIEMLRQHLLEERLYSRTFQCEIRQLQQDRNILRLKLESDRVTMNEVD